MIYDNPRQHSLSEWVRFYYDRIVPRPQTLINPGYPEGVDVSRWNESFDPALSQHQIDFAFQKITEGTTWIDPKVEEIWTGVAKVAVRGAYHYIRSGYSWTAQVNHFMSVFVRHDYHVAIVDLETNNGDNVLGDTLYADTRRWIDAVRKESGKRVVLYTNGSIWTLFQSAIKRLYADGQAWLNGLDLWLAWPSLTATEPITPCKIWQYRWDGTGYGTGSIKCDVNRFIGTKAELLDWANSDGTVTPPDDEVTTPYNGVVYTKGERYGRKMYAIKADTSKVRFECLHGSPLDTPTSVARKTGAQVVCNAGEWRRETNKPMDLFISNGEVYTPRAQAVPSLGFFKGGSPFINHNNIAGQYNVASGLRYLVEGGQVKAGLDNTYRTAKTVFGLTSDNQVLIIVFEGENPYPVTPRLGVSLYEAGVVAKNLGAQIAFDTGGGGDTMIVIDNELQNVPEDRSGGLPAERYIPGFLCMYAEEQTMARYEATAKGNGTRLRPDHNTDNQYKSAWPAGSVFHGDNLFVAPVDLYKDGNMYQKKGDIWLEVVDVTGNPSAGTARTGWVSVTHLGSEICTLKDTTPPPPPPVDSKAFHMDADFNEDGTITGTWYPLP